MHIEKGTAIPGTNNVVLNTGDYEPDALVECGTVDNPDVSVCAYQAHFIAIGHHLEDKETAQVPALSAEQKHILKTLFADFDSAAEINLDSGQVVQALAIFEQYGLLSAGRSIEILNEQEQE